MTATRVDRSPSQSDAPDLVIVGAGLAGCEAAWQAARRGLRVVLYEMKPVRMSPAHGSEDLAELVCSNSLRAAGLHNAVGVLKAEMRLLGSLIIEAADATAVPAGRALAVDRTDFQKYITHAILCEPLIELRRELVSAIPDAPLVILATGPLTAPEMARSLQDLLGEAYLYFYDAIAPTLYADSIDHAVVFRASRYEEGEGDYLNIPLDKAQYEAFVQALLQAETVPLHKFEAAMYFEGCLPIEEMARRGIDTLAYGPMKPVGLVDPRSGQRPHAVVQLRQEDKAGVLFNLVGFQTKLRVGEQKRILRTLPGLENAVFARFGSVHRNTYVNAPRRLAPTLELHARPGLYIAGQMAGVEGYVESAALGLIASLNACAAARGREAVAPPRETAHGALLAHLAEASPKNFQPMNVNFGLFPPLSPEQSRPSPESTAEPRSEGRRRGRRGKLPKAEKNSRLAARALAAMEQYRDRVGCEAFAGHGER
jgi:methylenetetrahydrofolate--tRNA-(uracil-5-)-methyltransferase